MRMLRWIVATAAISALAFVAIGGWHTSQVLLRLLTVGSPMAQGEGWPAPETPLDIGFTGDPRAAFGIDFEDVALPSEMGPTPAWLIRPNIPVEAGIWGIVVHGIGGRRENGYRFVEPFLDAGMPVMLIAYRNDRDAPRSREGLYAFGLTEWRDLETAVDYAISEGASSVALLGESMGGGIVGQFMRRSPQARHVSALLFDAPALDFPAVLHDQMRRAEAPLPGILAPVGMQIFGWRTGVPIAKAVVLDDVVSFDGPVFLSHGAGDRIVPVEISDALVERRGGSIDYLRTDADHIQSYKSDPERYRAALTEFLRGIAGRN